MAGASNYNAKKYLNTEGIHRANNDKLTLSEEKKKQFQQEYLKEFNDEMRAKNWNMNQTRMTLNLNELINTLASRSSQAIDLDGDDYNGNDDGEENDECENENNYGSDINNSIIEKEILNKSRISTLDHNSSTDEFRQYLEDLKKNYLEKLTLTQEKKSNEEEKLKSVENVMNLVKKVKVDDSNLYETSKSIERREDLKVDEDNDESPELTSGQILSRLMQIREYLKQAYTMLSSLQDSNDLANYASQMNKLHSLIDHLKDQEKGYMDLLDSFSKYQQLTKGLYEVNTLTPALNKSKSNPALRQFQKNILDLSELNESVLQQQKKQQLQQNELGKREKSLDVTNSTINESQSNSFIGSFISDTLTLNGANGDFDDIVKYKTNTNKSNTNEDLMIIGKALLKNQEKDESEDNEDAKTDNDQEVLDFDDDHYNQIEENDDDDDDEMVNKNVSIKEQRKEILNEIDNDLTTLEQLREQKKLLRSIRLRKEELKALEGRRKALEALKTIALDGESQLVQAFDVLSKSKNNEEEKPKLNIGLKNAPDTSVKEIPKIEQQQLLLRKTFKQNDSNEITSVKVSKIEPSSQIEKSKKTVKHYEDLIRKNINLANESYKSKAIINIDKADEALNGIDELEEKKVSLAENERKLKELYSMQERLSQLKGIINHFNGLKQTQSEFSQLREESETAAPVVSNETKANISNKLDQYLSEQNEQKSAKINMKANENLQMKLNNQKKSNINDEKKDSIISKMSNLKNVLEQEPCDEESVEGESFHDDELLEEHKKKLANAKEKLKQLQDLIVKLQVVSSNPNETLPNLTPKQIHETQQKEASKALDVLNQLEKQKTEEKLNELKQNKERLLKLLKEKEKESELLTKLYSSHSSQYLNTSNSSKKMEDLNKFKASLLNSTNPSSELEMALPSFKKQTSIALETDFDIEDKFVSAEGDFDDAISIENMHLNQRSPSDLLWNQMKKQLNMRENLRNKKKELEDMIRNENAAPNSSSDTAGVINQSQMLELKEKMLSSLKAKISEQKDFDNNDYSNNEEEGYAENNDIINGYRDFFMKKKSAFNSEDSYDKDFFQKLKSIKLNASKIESEAEEEDEKSYDEEEEDIIMKRYKPEMMLPREEKLNSTSFRKQQENVLSADELIKKSFKYKKSLEDNDASESSSEDENSCLNECYDESKPDGELLQVFSKYGIENSEEENFQTKKIKSNKLLENKEVQQDSAILKKLDARFAEMLANQQKFNETIQRNFTDVVKTLSRNSSNVDNNQQQQQHQNIPSSLSSQFQFQTQVQVQQLMFNLNTAYHEISMQKNEITNLHEQIKAINVKLTDLSNKPTLHQQTEAHSAKTERINHQSSYNKKEREQNDPGLNLNNTVISNNALPSYFYNQKSSANTQTDQASNRYYDAYYTDDFEEFEEDEEHDHKFKRSKKNQSMKKIKKRSSSSSRTTSTSVDSSRVSKSSGSSESSFKSTNSCSSSSSSNNSSTKSKPSSTLAFRKSSISNTYEINSETSEISNVHEFDKMREKIYSGVATLISQNERFPKYLLSLFKELQRLKTESQRDQALKSIFNVSIQREIESTKAGPRVYSTYNKFNVEGASDYKRPKQNNSINHGTQVHLKNFGNPFSNAYKGGSKCLDDMINSYSSIKQSKPAHSYPKKQDFDDDDDVITSASGLQNTIKSNKNVANASTHTDSDYDKKYFRSIESNNEDDLGLNAFENDSLSNTVIFVKNATTKSHEKNLMSLSKKNNSYLNSLDAHVHSTLNQTAERQPAQETDIGHEVKNLISKIITSIKLSDNFSDDDDDDEDGEEDESFEDKRKRSARYAPDSKDNYKYARCDNDYLNEIIEKVLNVLKSSNKYFDYLRLYQNQLSSYLRDALQKYHNQRLVCVLEEILIDISDILCNELTFYTIMNKSRIIKSKTSNNTNSSMSSLSQSENCRDKTEINLNLVKSLARGGVIQKKNENYKRSWSNQADKSEKSWSTTSENDENDDGSSSGTGEKVYFFDGDSFKSKLENIEFNLNNNSKTQMGIDLLNRLKFLLKNRFSNSPEIDESNNKSIKLFDGLNFDDLNSDKTGTIDKENGGFELKLIKYLSETTVNKQRDEITEESESNESETDSASIQTQASVQKEENPNDLHYKVVDINDIIQASDEKIPETDSSKTDGNVVEEKISIDLTVEKDLLNNIIMESIDDGLVGDSNALPLPIDSQKIDQNTELLLANQIRESTCDNQSQNSESSNSNSEFVYISTASSSDSSSVVEIKKSSSDLDSQDKVLVNNENGSPEENSKSESQDEQQNQT